MRLPRFKKRFIAGAMAAGMVMGAGGIAAAYFTATGTGTGSGSVGTPSPWTVTGGHVTGSLYPGGPAHFVVTASVKNPTTAGGNQKLDKIVATFTHVTTRGIGTKPFCSVTTFAFTTEGSTWSISPTGHTAAITPGTTFAPGQRYTIITLKVELVTSGATQDNCAGQTLTIKFTAS